MKEHKIDWSSYRLPGEGDEAWRTDHYSRLPELLGAEVLAWEDENDYQGSSFAILKHDNEYGYLTFGWGSCSGCDAMQAAEGDREETIKVFEDLLRGTKWFPSLEDAQAHVAAIGDEQHEWHLDEFKGFQSKVAAL